MTSQGSLGSSNNSSWGPSSLGAQTPRHTIETTIERSWQFDQGQHKSKCRQDAADYLEERLRLLAKSREPADGDEAVRQNVIQRLQEQLAVIFPLPSKLQLVPYGSFLSSCYSHASDLDLALSGVVDERALVDDSLQALQWARRPSAVAPLDKLSDEQWVALLRRLADSLDRNGMTRGPVTRILEARVPIIKFLDDRSGIECDICVTTRGCDFKGAVMRQLHVLQPSLAPLVRLAKLWAKHHDINSAHCGTLNSWSLALMALFSLQSYPDGHLLPPLWRLFHDEEPGGPGGAGRPLQDKSLQLEAMLELAQNRCSDMAPQLLHSKWASAPAPGIRELLLWFLSCFTAVTGQWRDSAAHRNWRVSPWLGRGYTARFPKPYLAAVEEPFDCNDNTARSVGVRERNEKTLPYIAWVFGHSVHLLRNVQTVADAARALVWLFGPDCLPFVALTDLKVPSGGLPPLMLQRLERVAKAGRISGSGSGSVPRKSSGGSGEKGGAEAEGGTDSADAAALVVAFRVMIDATKLGSPIVTLDEWRHHHVVNRSKPPHGWHRLAIPPPPPQQQLLPGGGGGGRGPDPNPNHHPQFPAHLPPGPHPPPPPHQQPLLPRQGGPPPPPPPPPQPQYWHQSQSQLGLQHPQAAAQQQQQQLPPFGFPGADAEGGLKERGGLGLLQLMLQQQSQQQQQQQQGASQQSQPQQLPGYHSAVNQQQEQQQQQQTLNQLAPQQLLALLQQQVAAGAQQQQQAPPGYPQSHPQQPAFHQPQQQPQQQQHPGLGGPPGLGPGLGGFGGGAGGGGLGAAGGFGYLANGAADVRQLVAALQGGSGTAGGEAVPGPAAGGVTRNGFAPPPLGLQGGGGDAAAAGAGAGGPPGRAAAGPGSAGPWRGGDSAGQALLAALKARSVGQVATAAGQRAEEAPAAAGATLAGLGMPIGRPAGSGGRASAPPPNLQHQQQQRPPQQQQQQQPRQQQQQDWEGAYGHRPSLFQSSGGLLGGLGFGQSAGAGVAAGAGQAGLQSQLRGMGPPVNGSVAAAATDAEAGEPVDLDHMYDLLGVMKLSLYGDDAPTDPPARRTVDGLSAGTAAAPKPSLPSGLSGFDTAYTAPASPPRMAVGGPSTSLQQPSYQPLLGANSAPPHLLHAGQSSADAKLRIANGAIGGGGDGGLWGLQLGPGSLQTSAIAVPQPPVAPQYPVQLQNQQLQLHQQPHKQHLGPQTGFGPPLPQPQQQQQQPQGWGQPRLSGPAPPPGFAQQAAGAGGNATALSQDRRAAGAQLLFSQRSQEGPLQQQQQQQPAYGNGAWPAGAFDSRGWEQR